MSYQSGLELCSASLEYVLQPRSFPQDTLMIEGVTTLPELFESKARQLGDATLFSFRPQPGADLATVSYRETLETTNRLAWALCNIFQPRNTTRPVFGIWFEKSIELHYAILATTTAGAAWLPFDADAPAARVGICLQDSGACALLCDAAHYESSVEAAREIPSCSVVSFDDLDRLSRQQHPQGKYISGPDPHDTAYFIYTSGSTGTPKGIEIPHSAALNFCLSERSVLGTGPDDIVWQGFSPAFDMFIEEVWVSIAGGAQLAIGSRFEYQNIPELGGASGVWADRGVTLVNAVPTLINIMTSLDEDCSLPHSIRLLNLGGEACPPSLVKRLSHPGLRILNTYGPSETTVTATFQELLPDEAVTIGRPLPLYHALVLPISDALPSEWSPLRIQEGVEGELAIGGQCLGKGYVGRPALTAEKFIQHPLFPDGGEKLYRTGDQVRLDKDLNIVFLGRIDTQVKHRGFRIELGEIDAAIASHPNVQTAMVILSIATNRLEAFIIAKNCAEFDIKEFRGSFQHLPAYMHPEAYHFISAETLPRLPSGKVNGKGLQELSASFSSQAPQKDNTDTGSSTIAGSGDDSDLNVLIKVMRAVFPHAIEIAPESDFFEDLGGHSLAAAMLVSKLRKECYPKSILRRISLQDIYVSRTAEQIVASLTMSSDSEMDINEKCEIDSSLSEKDLPVSCTRFFLCGLAQIPALLLFFFIAALSTFGPYLVFYVALRFVNLGKAIAFAYAAFVVTPVLNSIIGIVGKWAAIGKAIPGEYPLYGTYYYRWWLAEHFLGLVDMVSIAETPLTPFVMRCLGARIGSYCHLGSTTIGAAVDLVTIGDDVVIGRDSALCTSWVERGRLILAPIRIGSGASVGTQSVLEGGSCIEDDGEIGPLSMLPSGAVVPTGERWVGSPAQFRDCPSDIGHMRTSRPHFVRITLTSVTASLTSVFILPVMYFVPQIPSMLLFEYLSIPGFWIWAQTAIVAPPAAALYFGLVFLELFVFKWLILGKVQERSYHLTSFYNYRKWLIDRLMDMSLMILHPVYATLYVVPFLRSLGVKIGHMAEVSTGRGIDFELTEIGDESFIADGVYIGDRNIRGNAIAMKKTKLRPRAFAGNSSLIPQGTELPTNSLVGVLSIPPETALKEGESCFGSPPVLMPARQSPEMKHPDYMLYAPGWGRIAVRLLIEGMRIFLPRVILIFGLGFGVQIFYLSINNIGVGGTILLLPLYYLFLFAVPALVFTIICKWIIIGRYSRAEWPLWSVSVWKSEFVTSVYETVAVPLLARMLTGTPFLAWVFRLLGVQIGARATILTTDITEYDMVSIGDEAVINRHCHPQTHLFEDRVMKVGRVDIEEGGCMKSFSIALPNSRIGARGQLGSLSLVMKGEIVPAGETWEGDPIAPARYR